MSNSSNILKYVSSNLLIKIFVFISQIIIAFFITTNELGELKTAQAIAEVLSLFACLGFNASILAIAPKIEEKSKRIDLYSKILTLNIVFTFIIVVIFVFSLYIFHIRGFNISFVLFLIIPIASLLSVITLVVSFIQSEKLFSALAKNQLISKLISLPLVILFCFLFGLNGYIIVLYFTTFLTAFILYKTLSIKMTFKLIDKATFESQWGIAKGALFSNVLGTVGFYAGLFITNIIVQDSNIVGAYAFVLIIISGFEVISRSVQQYYIPFFSKDFSKGNLRKIEEKYIKLSFLLIIPSILMLMLIYFNLPSFKYADAILPLIILILTWGLSFKYNLKAGYFISCGKTFINFKISLVNIISTIILSFIFGYYFGIIGIATSRLITVIILIFTYKKFYDKEKFQV